MKEFIKRWILIFGMIVISVFVITSLIYGNWDNTLFVVQLLGVALVICLLQLLTNKIPVRTRMVKYLVDFGMVFTTVLLFGWIWQWYNRESIWIMILTVAPVFVAAILLDLVKVRHDVKIINKHIQLRKQKLRKDNTTDDY